MVISHFATMSSLADASPEFDYDDGKTPFDAMSDEERSQYLKDRGLQVPGGSNSAVPPSGTLVPCFTYVKIPADDKEPFSEVVLSCPLILTPPPVQFGARVAFRRVNNVTCSLS